MARHTFKFPPEVVESVRAHVKRAIQAVDPRRYSQEPNYTAALVSQLEGRAYEGRYGSVVFHATVFDDRGRNSAESRLGADHAITAYITDGLRTVEKVILVQAKLGKLREMNHRDASHLNEQIQKMKQLVPAPKVMQIPQSRGRRSPQMVSGNNVLNSSPYKPMDLEDYFVARVTTTLDGCTNRSVVEIVQESTLTKLHVSAHLKGLPALRRLTT